MRLLRERGSQEESIMRLLRERGSEEVSRRRARTASGSGGMLPGMLRSDSTGVRLPSVMETPDGDELYPAESEIDMIMADDAAKAKAEMLALVVASRLATVSVCLFRWTKIKLFQAFEKWHEVCFLLDDDDLLVAHGRRARVLSMLERTKMGPGTAGRSGLSPEDIDDGRVSGDGETVSGWPGRSRGSRFGHLHSQLRLPHVGRYLRPDVFNQSGQRNLLALLLYSGLHTLLGR
jgi:hypothetical protein